MLSWQLSYRLIALRDLQLDRGRPGGSRPSLSASASRLEVLTKRFRYRLGRRALQEVT